MIQQVVFMLIDLYKALLDRTKVKYIHLHKNDKVNLILCNIEIDTFKKCLFLYQVTDIYKKAIEYL